MIRSFVIVYLITMVLRKVLPKGETKCWNGQ